MFGAPSTLRWGAEGAPPFNPASKAARLPPFLQGKGLSEHAMEGSFRHVADNLGFANAAPQDKAQLAAEIFLVEAHKCKQTRRVASRGRDGQPQCGKQRCEAFGVGFRRTA